METAGVMALHAADRNTSSTRERVGANAPIVDSRADARARRLLVLAAAMLMAGVAGCVPGASPGSRAGSDRPAYAGPYPYTIVATTGMVADIVRQVAGEKAQVIGLMGQGVDPHLYKPTRHDVRRLMEAEVVFYSGLMLEGRMTSTLENIAQWGKPVVAVTSGLDPDYLIQPEGAVGHPDPHVWMDAAAWSRCVETVATTLARFDPNHAEYYANNATAYRATLAELDAYVEQAIASIPEPRRVLVTAHDAFSYFSRRYDIPVRAIQGLSTDSQAGVNDINRLVDFLVRRKVPAIFVESSVSAKNVYAVIEGARQQGWELAIGGELFSDAMGKLGTPEGTYVGMLAHNAATIAKALGGEVPSGKPRSGCTPQPRVAQRTLGN